MERYRLRITELSLSDDVPNGHCFKLLREGGNDEIRAFFSDEEARNFLRVFIHRHGILSMHSMLGSVVEKFKIKISEINIIENKEAETLVAEVLFTGNKKELRLQCPLADGVILSRVSSADMFIEQGLYHKYAVERPPVRELSAEEKEEDVRFQIEHYKKEIKKAIKREDYERAEQLEKDLNFYLSAQGLDSTEKKKPKRGKGSTPSSRKGTEKENKKNTKNSKGNSDKQK